MTDPTTPVGWATVRLDDIAEVRLGRQRSPKNHSGKQMRRYLRAANLTWDGIDTSDVKEMNFTDDEVETYRLRDGDLLLSEASGSAKEVGKPGVWRGQLDGDVCFQNTLIRVRPEQGIDSDFLYYRFLYEALRGGFVESSRGVGIHHLGAANLGALRVDLPPTAEQRRVADEVGRRLESWQVAQRDLGRLRSRLTLVAGRVLAAELEEFRDTTKPLAELLAEGLVNGRSVPTRDGGFPVLRLTALRDGAIDLRECKHGDWTAEEAQRWLVSAGDFLVSRGNGSLALVGRGGLVAGVPDPVAFPDTLIRVRVNEDKYDPQFLALVWNSRFVRKQIESSARTTAGIYKINQTGLEAIELPVPPRDVQRRIAGRVEAAQTALAECEHQVRHIEVAASAMRRAILAEAFAGRLATSDSADTPVDVLLKNIAEELEERASAARARKRTVRKTRTPRAPKTEETTT